MMFLNPEVKGIDGDQILETCNYGRSVVHFYERKHMHGSLRYNLLLSGVV